mgnify:CR=1 FL=1
MFYYYDWTMILLVPVIIFTIYAQTKVSSNYNRYSQVRTARGITGVQAAQEIMRANGINVPIEVISGRLTDHYDPSKKVLRFHSFGCSCGSRGGTRAAACARLCAY